MENWMLAAAPPLVVWILIFLFTKRVESRVAAVEKELKKDQ